MACDRQSNRAAKRALRRDLRAARRAVGGRAAQAAAEAVARRVTRLPAWRRARRIGLFLPGDGEIDTRPLIREARAAGKQVCLPVLIPPSGQRGRRAVLTAGRLRFRLTMPGTPVRRGALWVLEPVRQAAPDVALNRLDLLLLPLVGFDAEGRRLGMGGGFYDRTLAGRGRFRRPRLIGIAHACQQVARLPEDPWDQRLEACVTDTQTWTW